jgi:predicted MFS family arabinose efflux permease
MSALRAPAPARAGLPRLTNGLAFALLVSIAVVFLAASSIPTPLYSIYGAEWGFSSITVTAIFGVYAVAVLAALLTVGSLSDFVGRKPVLLVAIAIQAIATVLFASADGVASLFAARIVQGLATGLALGAIGAGLLDLCRPRGTIANGVGPLTGTAVGSIASSLLVAYLPSPTHLVWIVLLTLLVLQWLGVALMPETVARKDGALASLRPQLRVSAATRRPVALAVPILVAIWALAGFYGSLGPALARRVVGSTSIVVGGSAFALLAASAAIAVFFAHRAAPHRVMLLGAGGLLVGVGLTLAAIDLRSALLFFGGTIVAGAGFGAGFQGALRSVVPLAAPHDRAGVLSVLYAVSYLSMGVPAVIGGVLVAHAGLLQTAGEYGAAVMVLAILTLTGLMAQSRGSRRYGVSPIQGR